MRTVTIPAPIPLVDPASKQPLTHPDGSPHTFTFAAFVSWLVNGDPRFNDTGPHIRAGMRIEQDPSSLRPDDWELLHEVAEEPKHGYPTLTATNEKGEVVATIHLSRQLLPFVDAIANAKKEGL